MITGSLKTEKEYRAMPIDSSSSLKEFSLDRKKYFRKYILSEKVEEEDNKASVMGRLVECLLWEPDKFDDKFSMSSLAKAPTGNMLAFVEALCKYTLQDRDKEDFSFETVAKKAHIDSQFKWSLERVLDNFVGKDPEIYYNEILDVRSKGLTVVTGDDVTNAERIVDQLRTNEFVAPIITATGDSTKTVYVQFQNENYEVNDVKFKSMLDFVIVDHKKKKIYVYDLKCTWSVEGFYYEYYLYRRAYIQAYLYYQAVLQYFKDLKYEVEPMQFIVCDSIGYYDPLIYKMSFDDLDDAYNGFTVNGREYPGVKQIIEELKFAKENDIWSISKNNYLSNGIVKLTK
jgi:hypothetical protein